VEEDTTRPEEAADMAAAVVILIAAVLLLKDHFQGLLFTDMQEIVLAEITQVVVVVPLII